jgi:hypothetical protein
LRQARHQGRHFYKWKAKYRPGSVWMQGGERPWKARTKLKKLLMPAAAFLHSEIELSERLT